MTAREMRPDEEAQVEAMKRALWPDYDGRRDPGERAFVWERPNGGLGGFAIIALRAWGDSCDSAPCPWLEGWWVAADLRRTGVGRALVAAAERALIADGFTELGSDADLDNHVSIEAHQRLGFTPTDRQQLFRKVLAPGSD